jgi:hypothetical protein
LIASSVAEGSDRAGFSLIIQIRPRYRALGLGEGGNMARSSILAIIDSEAGCLAVDPPPPRNFIAGTVSGEPQPRGVV